jgi:FlaA1/EpsC-like NDP-sugar epimerase
VPTKRASSSQSLRTRILSLSRFRKQIAMILSDTIGVSFSVWAAIWLTSGKVMPLTSPTPLITLLAVTLTIPLAWQQGLYRSIIRYIGVDLFEGGLKTVVSVSVLMGLTSYTFGLLQAPIRWAAAFCALMLLFVVGGRFCARILLNPRLPNREPVIVYGAGQSGARLTVALKEGNEYVPVALVDDNPLLHKKRVNGIDVHSPTELEALIAKTGATCVLLAMPSASRHRRRMVLECLSDFPVHVQTIPEIGDLVLGKARVDEIRDVDVADLLGRDSVPPVPNLLYTRLRRS